MEHSILMSVARVTAKKINAKKGTPILKQRKKEMIALDAMMIVIAKHTTEKKIGAVKVQLL